jgi:Vacuolar sorting protein 9 (VPS9) domain
LDLEDIINIEFKEFFKVNHANIEELPLEIQMKFIQKAKIRPYQKSVLKFREIMMSSGSPLDKLFLLQNLKTYIQEDILEFWDDLISDRSKLTLNRDELTSIMLFIIARAEIPDLMSQWRLITEFTSEDI